MTDVIKNLVIAVLVPLATAALAFAGVFGSLETKVDGLVSDVNKIEQQVEDNGDVLQQTAIDVAVLKSKIN